MNASCHRYECVMSHVGLDCVCSCVEVDIVCVEVDSVCVEVDSVCVWKWIVCECGSR